MGHLQRTTRLSYADVCHSAAAASKPMLTFDENFLRCGFFGGTGSKQSSKILRSHTQDACVIARCVSPSYPRKCSWTQPGTFHAVDSPAII